uniref:Uncharacterized protein n=2 Tax=Physcomitrium patens TaxID=3218 RepID=A0A7I3ZEE6_PHYPA
SRCNIYLAIATPSSFTFLSISLRHGFFPQFSFLRRLSRGLVSLLPTTWGSTCQPLGCIGIQQMRGRGLNTPFVESVVRLFLRCSPL